jgi:DNA-binding IscR family transcriptional regulator
MIGAWFVTLVILIAIYKYSSSQRKKKKARILLRIMAELSKARETILTEELTIISGLSTNEIEKVLQLLERESVIYSPRRGFWKLPKHLSNHYDPS